MKKILTFALCIVAAGSISAQKDVVKQAEKLSGKVDKIADARNLIQQAASNPETQNDPRTYFVAGKIEFDAFDDGFKKQMINPNDKSVNPVAMGEQLINGYNYFTKALELDGASPKPQFKDKIASKLNGHFNDYFNAGGTFYNEKKYYPEAYEAFMIYGNMPSQSYADKTVKSTPDSVVNTSFFNAGLSAYAGSNLEASAKAFKAARLNNSDNNQNYVYEIACWQYLAQQDSTKSDEAKAQIKEIAEAGFNKFGMAEPLFLNNLINSYVMEDQLDKAIETIDKLLVTNPQAANLYGLRGYINDRKGDDDASVADYKKAVAIDTVDFETLKNAAKKIFRVGTQKWNNIEGATPEQRNDIKVNYFQFAKDVTDKAKEKNTDSDLEYVIENIDYALETFFNK